MIFFSIHWYSAITLCTLTVLLTLSAYHLAIYIGRRSFRSEIANLYFSIFSCFYCFLLLLHSFNSMFPDSQNIWLNPFTSHLELIIAGVTALSGALFFLKSYEIGGPYHKILFIGTGFMILAGIVIIPRYWMDFNEYIETLYKPALILSAIGITLVLGVPIVKAAKKKVLWKGHMAFISAGVLIITFENFVDRTLWLFGINHDRSYYLLSVVAIVLFSYSLIRRFNQEFHQLERLKTKLNREVDKKTSELQRALSRLKRLNQEKTTFYLRAAHETKTPLTLIKNYIEKMLKQQGKTSELTIIDRNLNQLIQDMNQLMDMEKFEKEENLYNHEQLCDLQGQIEQMEILFKEKARREGLSFSCDLNSQCWVRVDPSAINRIVYNLFDNALKYSNPGGSIHLSVSRSNGMVELAVQDNGRGIPHEEQNRIFDLFSQVQSNSETKQGLGMGLHVVMQILESVEGNINLESEPGLGSTFTVSFKEELHPVENSIPVDLNEEGEIDWQSLDASILIVEDTRDLRNYLEQEFSEVCHVETAVNGVEALKILEKVTVDLIISDILMPEMDGLEFFNRVKVHSEYRTIPFLFLTARSSSTEKVSQLKKGALDYINKPFSINEVLAKGASLILHNRNARDSIMDETLRAVENLVNKGNITPQKTPDFEKGLDKKDVTPRQKEIILLINKGLEYKEIAFQLDISPKTINRHMQILYNKFKVNNKIELLNYLKTENT